METTSLQSFLESDPLGKANNLLHSFNPAKMVEQAFQIEMTLLQTFVDNNPFVKWWRNHISVNVTINGAPASVPEGTTINLTSTVTEIGQIFPHKAGFTYAWNVTDNGQSYASGNQANFSFTPDDNGTYVVSLTATDPRGRQGTISDSITVTDVPPSVSITGVPSQTTLGSAISASSVVTDPSSVDQQAGFTYNWTAQNTSNGVVVASGNQANFSFTPTSAGMYIISLTATDKDGETGSAQQAVTVTNPTPPSVSIMGVPSQATLGSTISASSVVTDPNPVDQQAGFTYSWTAQNTSNGAVVASGNQANFSFTPTSAGMYVIALTATDKDGESGSAQQAVTVTNPTSTPSNLILLPPNVLASLQQQAAANTPQWQAFKARLDQELPLVVGSGVGSEPGSYEGSELSWIADYALGYQILKDSDPATAASYADKAIAIMESALNDYQKGQWTSYQYLARGDGSTTTFTLPNSGIIPSSLMVYEAPVQTVAVVRGTSNADTFDYYQKVLKVSNTPDGNADYVEGTDWQFGGNLPDNEIGWLPSGNQPAAGSTYYITETSALAATPVAYTLNGNTITLATPPTAGQAIFVQYVYNTPTLNYQQTSAGDGGFNSIFVDDTYTSRYLGKYVALGLNWLDGYAGFSPALQNQAVNTLQQWFNYLPTNGYNYNSPASNYGAGSYVSQVFTALALQGLTPDASQMLSDVLAYRQNYLLPDLQNPTTSLNGGFWAEGWNYGQLATENLLEAGLALQDAGQITATAEAQWASQVIEQVIEASPSAGTIYDGGDWFADPAPFPGNEFFDVLSAMASDPAEQAYANYILQNNPAGDSNDVWDLLFRNPSAPASSWVNVLPLQYFAQGTGLLTARSDWGSTPTWVSFQMGNLLAADHQSYTPGQLQIQRGADDLLINADAVGDNQAGGFKSTYGNTIIVNDNGDGVQTYPYTMGVWYGTPGVTVTAYEASDNYVYMAGNYAAAYSPAYAPGSGGPVSELTREMVYLSPNYVVVYDRVTTLKDTYPKEQQWMFLNAPTVSGNSFVETVGSSSLFGQTFSTVPLTTTVAPVQVGDATVQQLITQNASPTVSVRYVTAFETAPSTTTTMDATEHVLTTDGRMEGTQIGTQLVLFGYAAGTVDLTTPVTYALSGTSSVDNLLVDLQAGGVYQVQADGTLLGNVTASSQGTISFTTPAGAQQVTVTRVE